MVVRKDIDTFCRFARVSRETITTFENYEKMLLKSNKKLNLIGKSTESQIWMRHFLDSYQVIDFIEEKTEALISIIDGKNVLDIIESAHLSHNEKKIVSVNT